MMQRRWYSQKRKAYIPTVAPPQTPDETMKCLLTCEIAQRIGGMPSYLVDDEVWAAAEAEADATYIPLTEEETAEWYRRNATLEDTTRWLNAISAAMNEPDPTKKS